MSTDDRAVARESANRFLHRSVVWIRVAKTAALFLLPMPLLFAVVAAAISGDSGRLVLATSALGCFWSAGLLTWRALVAEVRWILGDRLDLPAIPLKLLGLVLTGTGSALAALAGGHSIAGALPFAGFSLFGYLAFYGRDLRAPRLDVAAVDGVDVMDVRQQLEQAHQRLRRIEAAGRTIAVPEFAERLTRIIGLGRNILDEVQRDPRKAGRARRFLHLYINSTERVTEEYARTHRQVRDDSLDQNFRRLLVDMENTFCEQHRKLLETDVTALDVEIEVLNARLRQDRAEERRQGVPVDQRDHVETRS